MDAAQTVQAAVRAAAQAGGGQQLVMRAVIEVSLGQMLAARVVGSADGQVELAIGGRRVSAQAQVPLEPGQRVRLQVTQADDARIALRVVPEEPPAQRGAPALPGLPAAVSRALMAALAELPAAVRPDPASLAQLAQRAVAAGVQTPAQADAFVRLAAAGLPTTPAAVAGLAELAEGPQLGRALTMLIDALRAQAQGAAPQGARPGAAPGAPAPAPPQGTAPGSAPGTAPGSAPAGAPVGRPPAAAPAPGVPSPPTAPTGRGAPAPGTPATSPATAPPGAPAQAPAGAAVPMPPALAALTALVEDIARRAAAGDPRALRRAITDLGHVPPDPRARGGEAAEPSLRALLMSIAADPETAPHTARLAERTADGIAAQALVPAAAGQHAEPLAQGAYLQVPLPGGQTAEVRVMPDDGGAGATAEEGGRPTRIAFLLTMSSLGQVVVEATVGPGGTDAVVRSSNDDVREFLRQRTADLAEALGRAGGGERGARVGVDRMAAAEGRRLIPGPPATGLDLTA